ncbi:MAG: hypothetical protein C4K58_00990 [Flavobacteriaceae bacterium]|nr:MAG: hypothetical protein C4K58_00990 [Flavobacteriaceae bacterium]
MFSLRNTFFYFLLISPLLVSLYIYLGFRTNQILVHQLVLKSQLLYPYTSSIKPFWELPYWMIYNLPEGLWIFSLTLIAGVTRANESQKKVLLFLPIFYVLVLEIFQGIHITDGTFDVLDLLYAFVFWLLAKEVSTKLKVKIPKNYGRLLIIIFFVLVFLSDVKTL